MKRTWQTQLVLFIVAGIVVQYAVRWLDAWWARRSN